MGWDANWSTSKAVGKLPLNALTQLRAALLERTGVFSSFPGLYIPGAVSSGELPAASWFTTFQTAMTYFLDAQYAPYADHTQYSGDYSGQTVIPMWTEALALAECDVGTRIPAPGTGSLLAAWCWQQYQILNLLRWALKTPVATDCYDRGGADVAAWNAASWTATGATYQRSRHNSGVTPVYYNVVGKFQTTIAGSCQASGDVYVLPKALNNWWTDTGWTEDVLNNLETIAESGTTLTSAEYGNRAIAAGGDTYGYYVYAQRMVEKYTGANGFTYKDW